MPSHQVTPLFPDVSQDPTPDIEAAIAAEVKRAFPDRRPLMKEIMEVVCEYYGFTHWELESEFRNMHLVRARQVFCFLCRKFNGASTPAIGRRIGGRDHTTVLWGIRRIEQRSGTSQSLALELEGLQKKLAKKVLIRIERSSHGSDEAKN